jgi:peptidoglycan/LPS O-acetylase OafA/YrhL
MKSKNNILAYRADIDGLRAFAIVSVIVFHSFPDILPGGFIGVDVFFVISGYLISKIIYEGMSSNSFSFSEFYIHRIRRIFPALVVVLFVVLVFGWFALVAEEYALLGKHSAGGVAFVNNVLLWKEDGYFGKASELKPLMHLWSLGVEEQFYLVFPIFIWLIWLIRGFQFKIYLVVSLLAFLSFLANIYWVKIDSSGAFFLPHARLWELLIGSLLAYNSVFKDHKCDGFWIGKNLRYINCKELLSVIGFGFLIIGVFVIDKGKNFPGYWALLPVFGAALVIMSGPEAYFNRRLLSNNWMVFIGLISYPLYIWHWPILSYLRILEAKVPSVQIRLVAIFLLCYLLG